MSLPSGVHIGDECLAAFNELRLKRGSSKPKFIIYSISNNFQEISVEKISSDTDWENFLREISSSVDENGTPAPRYAAYDVEYDLGADGKRSRVVFIAWVPIETSTKVRMIYASTKEQLRKALDIAVSIHAEELDELDWKEVVREASGGKA
ncbi:hypothetical protein PENSTE_c013G00587 [Penicillium steckii]|uniref:Cofilin n=1 Tax=Penicillium steckii TaxID=303698 RepID=A0A1V6T2Q4_9EURO|nr:hypothetical protein PENSTE_c013G00587 [Penicillium steckii]